MLLNFEKSNGIHEGKEEKTFRGIKELELITESLETNT